MAPSPDASSRVAHDAAAPRRREADEALPADALARRQRAKADPVGTAAALCAVETLDDDACALVIELAERVPGRLRELCEALARTGSDASADALFALPRETPGRIEASYRALRGGARRPRPTGRAPAMLAFEFRRSRAADFAQVLGTVEAHLSDQLETLQVGRGLRYRFRIDPLFAARGGASLRTQLEWLQPRIMRRAGARMWLNGWAFDRAGPLSLHALPALMSAWLDWASGSLRTRRRVEIA